MGTGIVIVIVPVINSVLILVAVLIPIIVIPPSKKPTIYIVDLSLSLL